MEKLSFLLLDDDTDLEVRAKVNKLIDGQFPDEEKTSFLLSDLYYDENNNNTKDKLKDVLVKIKQFREMEKLSKNRLYSIPKNATIRAESIKCGSQL